MIIKILINKNTAHKSSRVSPKQDERAYTGRGLPGIGNQAQSKERYLCRGEDNDRVRILAMYKG